MIKTPPKTHIAYRCPDCISTIYGLVGKFALSADMLRLKCSCESSALDITVTNDKKIRLSVPCLFCKQNHSFVLSQNIFFERDIFLLNCPYSNMDIAFIGDKEKIDVEVERANGELQKLLTSLEAESVKDMQPTDLDEDDVLPDPAVYDRIRFLIKTLEDEGGIDCPCHSGSYDLRFCKGGIQVYCPTCEATHVFYTDAESSSEDYISSVTELKLK